MDRFTIRELNLTPRSDDELHSVLNSFELKWQDKVRRRHGVGRTARF